MITEWNMDEVIWDVISSLGWEGYIKYDCNERLSKSEYDELVKKVNEINENFIKEFENEKKDIDESEYINIDMSIELRDLGILFCDKINLEISSNDEEIIDLYSMGGISERIYRWTKLDSFYQEVGYFVICQMLDEETELYKGLRDDDIFVKYSGYVEIAN